MANFPAPVEEYAPERPPLDRVVLVALGVALAIIAVVLKEHALTPWLAELVQKCPKSNYFGRPCLEVLPYAAFVGVPLAASIPCLLLVWRGYKILRSGQVPPPGERVFRRTRIRRGRYATLAAVAHCLPILLLVLLAAWGALQADQLLLQLRFKDN